MSSVKVQAALTRAEEVAEKKHSAVWTAREGGGQGGPACAEISGNRWQSSRRGSTQTRTLA